MGRLLIIGCGGVAGVAIHKCCQNSKTFSEICIASRTKAKCDALKEKLENTTETKITTAQVDADKVEELIALIQSYQPDAVLNVALPYQDLTIMDACLACGVNYMDTANYEPEDTDDEENVDVKMTDVPEGGFLDEDDVEIFETDDSDVVVLHADDIDFQIEADYIGFMCPGMPQTANKMADKIGHIMN